MKKIVILSSALVLTAGVIISSVLFSRFEQTKGENGFRDLSVTLTASDIANAHGSDFTKGALTFRTNNVIASNNKILFKGLTDAGQNETTKPALEVLTGSIPSGDGTLSGQGFYKIHITGYDGTGYGLLGINSFDKPDGIDYIGYQQALPKEEQDIVPSTTETYPVAKFVHVMGKIGYNLSISSVTFCWTCEGEDAPVVEDPYLGNPYIKFNNDDSDKSLYSVMDGFSNKGMFLSYWEADNFSLDNGIASFALNDVGTKNYGVEIQSTESFKYGYFGGRMKAFKKEGTVQSIFTYSDKNVEHDEIDIEILGKDTTKIQFNYYSDGVGDHEYTYDLGFDASLEFHDYGFRWEESKITWFVDFVPVYEVDAVVDKAGNLCANVWAGNKDVSGISDWLGEYVPDGQTHYAYYDQLSYSSLDDEQDVKITSPKSKEVVSITHDNITNYIKQFKAKGASKENDYLLDINEVNTTSHTPRVKDFTVGKDVSKSRAVNITFVTSLSGSYDVYLSTNSDFSNAEKVTTSEKTVSFYNLYMATTYYVKIVKGTFESLSYSFTTADTVRLVYTSKTTNIRDIGGKMTRSGKRIKQGLIYRGQELVNEAYVDADEGSHVATLDTASINTLKNELGIGFEMDFRSTNELPDTANPSPAIEGMEYWHGSSVTSSGWVPSYNYISRDKNNLKMYKNIFQQFLRAADSPIYFHCWGGLDRTGTVAFILEGLLGCSFTDMCIDYELSSFSGSGALRQRDVDYQSGGKGYKTMVTQLVNNSAASGTFVGYNPNGTNDIQEICENILLTAGMTMSEINSLRNILLED